MNSTKPQRDFAIDWLREGVMGMVFIVTLGFYWIHLNIGVYLQYLFICIASFAAICIIYELLVRRITILRFLFDLKSICLKH
jgi:apolipoprotein N-acyltransferase